MSSSKFGSCACPEQFGIVPGHKSRIFKHFAGMVPMDRAWQDWVMSTQRREDRRLASCTDRAGAPEWVTTNSRRSDRRNQQRVRLVVLFNRFGSPPLRQAAARRPFLKRPSGLSPNPLPAVLARLHPSVPRVPAAMRCRTERYDGKRDLHFQHAA